MDAKFKVGDLVIGNSDKYSKTSKGSICKVESINDNGWMYLTIIKLSQYNIDRGILINTYGRYMVEQKYFDLIKPRQSHLPGWW